MDLQLVESSMIQAFGYDGDAETLMIVFNSGKTYQYSQVPKDAY